MLNVYRGVKKYDLGEPWITAAGKLATHPATGEFMRKGNYDLVSLPPNYKFPPMKMAFIASNGVSVTAGEDYARFQDDGTEYVFWRVEALQEQK